MQDLAVTVAGADIGVRETRRARHAGRRSLTVGRRFVADLASTPDPVASDGAYGEPAMRQRLVGDRRRGRCCGGCATADLLDDGCEGQLDERRIGDLEESVDRTQVGGRAALHVQDAIGAQLERLLDAVLDDDHGAALVGHPTQDGQQLRGGRGVQVGQRLVHDIELRPHHQDATHGHQLTLTARQRGRLPARQVSDAGPLEDLADPVADGLAGHGHVLGPEGQLRLDRRADDLSCRVLQDGADDLRQLPQAELGHGTTFDAHLASRCAVVGVRDEAVDAADERALAAARRPGHEEDLAGLDDQRDVADRRLAGTTVGEREVLHPQERRDRVVGR